MAAPPLPIPNVSLCRGTPPRVAQLSFLGAGLQTVAGLARLPRKSSGPVQRCCDRSEPCC